MRFDAVAGDAELEVLHQTRSVLAVQRGDAFAIVNRGEQTMATIPTELPEGSYCNLAQADCSSPVTVFASGKVRLTIPSMGAVILTALDPAQPE